MVKRIVPTFIIFALLSLSSNAQCPPAGFPEPGNTCPEAPVLCDDIDGYCATVNNNNIVQNFPGCPNNVLNNDEWFAFFAGTTTITLEIVPSDCDQSSNMGLQGGIYSECISNSMDLQCSCQEDPFQLTSSSFVVGEIYWLVIDGCAGNVCDYTVNVLEGSTVPFPPEDPDDIVGPTDVCVNESDEYSIPIPNYATMYDWTLDPPLGTITGDDEDISISWGGTPGTTELCVEVSNFCEVNSNPSCVTIEVHPEPSATLSGMGEVCENGAVNPVDLTIDFTGTPPWTFVYTIDGVAQPPITTSDNPYTLTVTDPGNYALESVFSSAGECDGTVSGSIDILEVTLEIEAEISTATCSLENGDIDVTVSGGEAPYTFDWSNGATTEDLEDVGPGTYTVTVTDANGCTGERPFTVDDTPNEPSVSATTTPAICGLENGDIDVTVSGGTAPYTYIWNNGETTEDLTDVEPGTYTVTVTGDDGCTSELSITLDDDQPPISINGTIVSNTTCTGGNGSIDITIDPATPPAGGSYVINWSNGETTTSLTDLPPGTYTVTVTNGTSCEGTASFTVPDDPSLIEINAFIENSTCELENGSVDVTVSGGVPPYSFEWSNGETTEDLDNIPSGSYSVTVTDDFGCTSETSFTVNNDNPPINVTADLEPNTGCDPASWDGSITITITPAVPPAAPNYTITWSTGETGVTTINDLEPGSYTVTVEGGGACETIATFNVVDEPNEPVINVNVVNSECGLSDGSASISVSGGVPPYTYLWSTGATGTSIDNVPAGNYSVTVTGANGCTAEAPVVIGDDPILFNVSSDIDPNTACDPASYNGSITITITPAGNYTILWSTGETTPTIEDLAPGSYSVTVSAGGNCEEVFSIAVPDDPNLFTLSSVITPATCGLSNGMILVSPSGGVFPMDFIWSNGTTGQSLSNVPAGTYSVDVTDANGCTANGTFTIPEEDIPIDITGTVVGNTSCLPGGGNGSIDIVITTNGTPTVTWSNGSTGNSLTNLAPGTYTVTVTLEGDCEEIQSFTVPEETELPNLSAVPTPSNCGLADGAADLTVNGGITPYTYLWSNGATTEDISDQLAGTYTITVTSATGCSNVTSVTIPDNTVTFDILPIITGNTNCVFPNGLIQLQVTPPGNYTYQWATGETTPYLVDVPSGAYTVTVSAGGTCQVVGTYQVFEFAFPPNSSATATAATCGQANGSVTVSIDGGQEPYTYEWSNGATTEELTNVPPGTYEVTVTDDNDCTTVAEATVLSNNVPINISGDATANTSCDVENGAIDITISPAGSYDIEWSTGATSEDISGLAPGSYSVTVSSGGDCVSEATFTVDNDTEDPEPTADITAAICNESNGAIDLNVSGATPPYSFVWAGGETSEDLNAIPPGDYTVAVTSANGCTAEATFNVPNNSSSFTLDGVASPDDNCETDNGSIDLTITPAGSYDILWSNDETTQDISNLPPGTYTVTVTESGSCSGTASFVVADETDFPTTSQTISAEICGQEDGAIDLTVDGGTAPYTFLWSNGETTEDLNGLSAGTYLVTVTGANGCTTEATGIVPDNSISIALNGTTEPNTSCDINNGAIDLNITPSGTYSISWSNGEMTEDLTGLAGGTYSVVVSAGGDCSASASFTVPSTTEDPVISQVIDPAICGENNGSIDLSITGGQSPFTFLWSNGATSEDLTNVLSGDFTVEVTGANGCVATGSFTIPNNSIVISIDGTAQTNSSCDDPNGSIDITASPASTTYTYVWSNGESTEDLNDLPPGNYSVTVFEGATCEGEASFNVGNDTNAPDLSEIITASICGEDNGSIDLTPSGGSSPYTFIWSDGSSGEDLVNVTAGDYGVTVTGADGCSNTGSYTIGDDQIVINVTADITPNTLCVDANGSIDISVDPPGTYGYEWSNGETTEDISNVPAGQYTVIVSGAGNCTTTATFTVVNDGPAVNVSGSVVDVLCFGGATGEIVVDISGGVAPYTFNWTPPIAGNPQNPSQLPAGDYTIEVTDASGCIGTADFTIAQPTDEVQITCSQTGAISAVGATDGEATISISGGTAPYAIEWTPGSSQIGLPVGDFVIDALGAGSYSVLVTDANGCETTCQFNIAPGGCVTEVGTMSNDLLSACGPDCLTASYDALNQFLEPDDILEFILHNGSGNVIVGEIARNDQPSFCFDAALMNFGTTYYISAVAGNDDGFAHVNLADICTVVSLGTPIVFYEIPVASINDPDPITCQVTQVDLTGNSSLPGSTFTWSTGDGEIIGSTTGPVIQVGDGGTYTLIIDNNGCLDTAAVTVEDLATDIQASIATDPGKVLDCTVDQITLTGTASGALDAEFTWTFNNMVISNEATVNVDESGVYTLTVYDPVSDCSDVLTIQIDDNSDFPPLFTDVPPEMELSGYRGDHFRWFAGEWR